ncbi:MAG: type ISP restriction/modification enzyme, partial [Pseudanabaena sp.]
HSNIVPCFYRIFDKRWLLYQQNLIEIGRGGAGTRVMGHILRGDNNIGLITCRQQSQQNQTWSFCFCSQAVIECCAISNKTKEANYFFPLYLVPDKNNPQKSTTEQQSRPNFSDEFLTEITNKLGYTPTPEAIFYYIYAIFHSPTYRTRYAEFLKIDFPRVPLTSDDQLFCKLGEYGEELVALHLMKSSKLYQPLTQIIDKGGEFVVDAGHPKFLPSPTGRGAGGEGGEVIINKKGDRFTGVPKSVWEFYVGGYQVCHKWLKDRKGRQLSPEDLNHYQKIIVALSETMQIMKAIDAAIPSFPIK